MYRLKFIHRGNPGSLLLLGLLSLCTGAVSAQEPPLPAGLGVETTSPAINGDEPALPSGLGDEPGLPQGMGGAPALPSGLDNDPPLPGGLGDVEQTPPPPSSQSRPRLLQQLSGFFEGRVGLRTQDDPGQLALSILEARLQLQFEPDLGFARLNVTADLLYDDIEADHSIDLEEGQGWLDLREFNLLMRPLDFMDIKLGRQVLTWGTGDLLFINDLFPKDWNSFFVGRDDEYLKAPSDTLKMAVFFDIFNIDLTYTPRFDSDRYIDGRRISYFNPATGTTSGRELPLTVNKPDSWFDDHETAVRIYRNLASFELALYTYLGSWKSPGGQDPSSGRYLFPDLNVYGSSLRGPFASGIINAEFGYYDSRDDKTGTDPFIRNSEIRIMAGYERELATELTGAVQWYLEHMLDHDSYRRTLPVGIPVKVEDRHVLTQRLTRLLMNQNLMLSLFNYYSPSENDGYLRLKANYKLTDAWQLESGANVFYGKSIDSFFGQFEDSSNVYLSIRYGF